MVCLSFFFQLVDRSLRKINELITRSIFQSWNAANSLILQDFRLIHYQFNFWHSAFFLDSISISIIQLINEIGIEIRKKKAEAEGVIQSEIHAA